MARRKTIAINTLVDDVNRMLRDSTCTADVRLGMCAVLENMLHETENYDGYQYLTADEVPRGHLPGIDRSKTFEEKRFPDESRRKYSCKTKS